MGGICKGDSSSSGVGGYRYLVEIVPAFNNDGSDIVDVTATGSVCMGACLAVSGASVQVQQLTRYKGLDSNQDGVVQTISSHS